MSTHDVPGHKPENRDTLRMGCWAEHTDGSYIFVYSTESDQVVYSLIDTSQTPVLEYRNAMSLVDFEKTFSTSRADIHKPVVIRGRKTLKEQWTWHDKTPFPWDKVMTKGAEPGFRPASAEGAITAAERIARDLELRARRLRREDVDHMVERESAPASRGIVRRLGDAFTEFLR